MQIAINEETDWDGIFDWCNANGGRVIACKTTKRGTLREVLKHHLTATRAQWWGEVVKAADYAQVILRRFRGVEVPKSELTKEPTDEDMDLLVDLIASRLEWHYKTSDKRVLWGLAESPEFGSMISPIMLWQPRE